MANVCDPFDITFTGSKDDLFKKMKDAASNNSLILEVTENDASSGIITIKKRIIILVTVASGAYKINGQIITITMTQLPPKMSCQDVKDFLNKLINDPAPLS